LVCSPTGETLREIAARASHSKLIELLGDGSAG